MPRLVAAQRPYTDTEVTVPCTDSLGRRYQLAGTLSVPDAPANTVHPAVLLLTGSGPQNRDEEIMGHKPFRILADCLAGQGYVVLRCDDRGVGGSTGAFGDVTTLDLATDACALVRYLGRHPAVDPGRIVLLGHSEGALVAAIAAVRLPRVAAVVMLAGPGLGGAASLLEQNEAIFRLRGLPDTLVARRLAFMADVFEATDSLLDLRSAPSADTAPPADTADLVRRLNRSYKTLLRRRAAGLSADDKRALGLTNAECFGWASAMATPWMQTFCRLEPADYLSQLRCPLLALGGSLDCQVIAHTHLDAIRRICSQAGVPCQTRLFPNLNHLFQQCQTGAVEEYPALGQSPAPEVLETLLRWLRSALP